MLIVVLHVLSKYLNVINCICQDTKCEDSCNYLSQIICFDRGILL